MVTCIIILLGQAQGGPTLAYAMDHKLCICVYFMYNYMDGSYIYATLYFVHHICVSWGIYTTLNETPVSLKNAAAHFMSYCVSSNIILFKEWEQCRICQQREFGNFVVYTKRKCTSWILVGGGFKEGHVWRQRRLWWSWSLVVVSCSWQRPPGQNILFLIIAKCVAHKRFLLFI